MSKDHLFWHKDTAGKSAPTDLNNKTYFHPSTQKLYRTCGISFDAERGRWMINYAPVGEERDDHFTYSHLPEDFVKTEKSGLARFMEIKK